MRLFVALNLPDELRLPLAGLARGIPGARLIAPENLHLTLRFIGEVDGQQARDIDAALSRVQAPGFAVTLAGLGHFGNAARARALWVGVEANPALMHLRAKVDQALQGAGLTPERRKFKPHVTLARLGGHGGPRLRECLTRNALFRAAPFVATDFVLMSSFLAQAGAIYTMEASYPLGPAEMGAAAPTLP